MPDRVVLVHIGKTGGTSIKSALRPRFDTNEVCPLQFEPQYPADLSELDQYRFFDSHIGYDIASQLSGHLITVLRNPYDRLVSLYHYWREVPGTAGGPGVAKEVSFERFLETARDLPDVALDTYNTMTWQLAHGTTQKQRRAHIAVSEDEILRRALDNLEMFSCVGVTENFGRFWNELGPALGLDDIVVPARSNVTKSRVAMSDIPMSLRKKMSDLVQLDIALYETVLVRYGIG